MHHVKWLHLIDDQISCAYRSVFILIIHAQRKCRGLKLDFYSKFLTEEATINFTAEVVWVPIHDLSRESRIGSVGGALPTMVWIWFYMASMWVWFVRIQRIVEWCSTSLTCTVQFIYNSSCKFVFSWHISKRPWTIGLREKLCILKVQCTFSFFIYASSCCREPVTILNCSATLRQWNFTIFNNHMSFCMTWETWSWIGNCQRMRLFLDKYQSEFACLTQCPQNRGYLLALLKILVTFFLGACSNQVAVIRFHAPLRNSFLGRGIVPVQGVFFAASRARGIGRPSRRGTSPYFKIWLSFFQADACMQARSMSTKRAHVFYPTKLSLVV